MASVEISPHLENRLLLVARRGEGLEEVVQRALGVYVRVMFDDHGHPNGRADPEGDVRQGLVLLHNVRSLQAAAEQYGD